MFYVSLDRVIPAKGCSSEVNETLNGLAQVVAWFCSKHVSDVSLDRVIPAKGCSSEVNETLNRLAQVVAWFCSKHVSDVSLDRVIPAKGCSSEVNEVVNGGRARGESERQMVCTRSILSVV